MARVASALVISGVLILISWVTSPAALTPVPSPPMSPADRQQIEQTAQAAGPLTSRIDEQAARLRARLAQPPPVPTPERNPFVFGRTPEPARGGTRPEEHRPAAELAPPVEPAPVGPILPTLVAITSDELNGAIVRTAALAIGDDLQIVKQGQSFDRFIVESIGADSVRLVDTSSPTRATFTIAIR